jgi:hypothetical protein
MKLSSQDQEAMRKLRSTMMEYSDSASSKSSSPLSPGFPSASAVPGPSQIRQRRSTLSKQITPEEDDGSQMEPKKELELERTPGPPLMEQDMGTGVSHARCAIRHGVGL